MSAGWPVRLLTEVETFIIDTFTRVDERGIEHSVDQDDQVSTLSTSSFLIKWAKETPADPPRLVEEVLMVSRVHTLAKGR